MARFRSLLFCAALFALALPTPAEVVSVEIESRESVLEGRSWGSAGAYELVRGVVVAGLHEGVDPPAHHAEPPAHLTDFFVLLVLLP